MKKMMFTALLTIFMTNSSFLVGALPPLYQSGAEIKAIVTHPHLGDYFSSGELILDIRRVNNGYVVTTNHQQLFAKIENLPSDGKQGPAQFDVIFQEVQNSQLLDKSNN